MAERESAIEQYLKSSIAELGGSCLKFGPPGIRGYPVNPVAEVPDKGGEGLVG